MTRCLFLVIAAILLVACTHSIEGQRYIKNQPAFKPENFFDGRVQAWGIVQNRSGNMVQQFTVLIDGTVADGLLTLDESFCYLTGSGVTKRVWEIELKRGGSEYRGTATDINGVAEGKVFGNAMRWTYNMELPVDGSSYDVSFDDWMWAFDSQRLVNRSYIKKWGFVVAEVTIFMEKIRITEATNPPEKNAQNTIDCRAKFDQDLM